jgi:hypothetical protein
MHYLPRGYESSPRGGWGICAPALPEVLTDMINAPEMANAVICPETGKSLKHQELITKLK